MKVLVKHSLVLGRLSLGKGLHDLPDAIGKYLVKNGLAINKTSVVEIKHEQLNLEVLDEKRTIIIKKDVDDKNVSSGNVKRRHDSRGKNASKGRSFKR